MALSSSSDFGATDLFLGMIKIENKLSASNTIAKVQVDFSRKSREKVVGTYDAE